MTQTYVESAAEEVVHALLSARASGQVVWLATVISTWGSSPRPPGSMMLWSPATGLVGSVSGGCVEDDLIGKFREQSFSAKTPELIIYGGDETASAKISLPCGGKLQLLVESLYDKQDVDLWQTLANKLDIRQGCLRTVNLASGEWILEDSPPRGLQNNVSEIAIYLGPVYKLLIVGANQIAAYLAQFSQALNFSVSVCDPGENTAVHFPKKGLRFLKAYPDGLIEKEFSDSASAIVAVSHDPRLDDMALLEALPGKAFYIGAMGSLRTSTARCKRLQALGISKRDLQKLKAPIGLNIGSKSPAEIAISIAADLIKTCRLDDSKQL